ncbi:hypothetical protein NKW45_05790 [Acetobacter orientalis]|uniref:hypothetical protein n=1 Tax=Acetobacter orientalis TaxID=146474 RepID=UPI0020A57A02|nr:hypothetical protein [Acetobacter orientalis]MCP1221358.1 hypothetical protein [Acetobacter orientalis]
MLPTHIETLYAQLPETQQLVASALQGQASALERYAAQQRHAGNTHGARRCTHDAEAIRERLEELLLSVWKPAPPAHASDWVRPC